MESIELLLPAVLATALLVIVHAQFGLQVLARQVVFVDLALAQAAALGATLAFAVGHAPASLASYGYSLGFALAAAMLLTLLRAVPARVPAEALIGILYVSCAAAAMLLIERAPAGAEHLKALLTGNIAIVDYADVWRLAPLYAAIGAGLAVLGRLGWLNAASPRRKLGDALFYGLFAVVVTSSVAIAGVMTVFTVLIVPATLVRLLSVRPSRAWPAASAFGCAAGWTGLALSLGLDWPAGPTIVCATVAAFVLASVAGFACRAGLGELRRMARAAGVLGATVLAAQAAWVVVAPSADQPLLDVAERVAPALRGLYMRSGELDVVARAVRSGAEYAAQAERLNAIEAAGRTGAAPLTDLDVARISSFVKSYNEMRRGEDWAARHTIERARTRNRAALAAAMAAVALLVGLGPLLGGRLGAARRTGAGAAEAAGTAPAH